MSQAFELYMKALDTRCPSNYLAESAVEVSRDQDWEAESTLYTFSDGSQIRDCNGQLEILDW
jgi:hypothetical protein